MSTSLPILYSFRRCPYAMRARMAIRLSGLTLELREILLKDKPQPMLDASKKGTVPVLVLPDGEVIDESRDIMLWALLQNDPTGCYQRLTEEQRQRTLALLEKNDFDFKSHLDNYKYAVRYPEFSEETYRKRGEVFLQELEDLLDKSPYLLGEVITLADIAIFPFIRQFANVDINWFNTSSYVQLRRWLNKQLKSQLFLDIMIKFERWNEGDPITYLFSQKPQ